MFKWLFNRLVKYSYDKEKLKEVRETLKFSSKRVCEDGLCCFIKGKFAREFDLKRNKSLALVQEHESSTKYLGIFNYACEYLRLNINENELEFSCDIYDKRNEICRGYPDLFAPAVKCIGEATVRNWRDKNMEKIMDMYAFEQGTHEFGNLVVGNLTYLLSPFRKYDLIPVPRNLCEVIPKNKV